MSDLTRRLEEPAPSKDSLVLLIEHHQRQFARNLTTRSGEPLIHPDKFVRTALTTLRVTPKLREASVPSLLGALMTCSQLGLEPGGPLQQAFLVPYENKRAGTVEAQLIVGYQGFLDLMYRSDRVASVAAHAVYSNDVFNFELGTNAYVRHSWDPRESRGELQAAYGIAELVSGSKPFDILSKADIDSRRAKSRGADSPYSPWHSHYEAMARKSAIRQLFKWMPSSVEWQSAVVADGATFKEIPESVEDIGSVIDIDVVEEGEEKGEE